MIYEHSVDTVDAVPPGGDFTVTCASTGAQSSFTLLVKPLSKSVLRRIKQQGSYFLNFFFFLFYLSSSEADIPKVPLFTRKAMQKVFGSVT